MTPGPGFDPHAKFWHIFGVIATQLCLYSTTAIAEPRMLEDHPSSPHVDTFNSDFTIFNVHNLSNLKCFPWDVKRLQFTFRYLGKSQVTE